MTPEQHHHLFYSHELGRLVVPEQLTPIIEKYSQRVRRFDADFSCIRCRSVFIYERFPVRNGFTERYICNCNTGVPVSIPGIVLFRVFFYD